MWKKIIFSLLFISGVTSSNLHSETLNLATIENTSAVEAVSAQAYIQQICKEKFPSLNTEAFVYALSGYYKLKESGTINKQRYLTIVDFSKPSHMERLYVIDIQNMKLVHKSLVAHGKNSGEIYAENFSNEHESYKSSLGFYLTAETYIGKNGFSLKLDGLEDGYNSEARERGVVIHAADYVSHDYINSNGRLGRSQGCPALPDELNEKIIHTIKGGTVLFIYSPNYNYLKHSKFLKIDDYDCLAALLPKS
jgi:hypothetical protein